jgi:uncharacterized protein (TIGR02996 family)
VIEIVVVEPGVPAWRRTYATGSILIGSAGQLRITNGVRNMHASIRRTGERKLVIVPHEGIVKVRGKRVKGETELSPRDELEIGVYALRAVAKLPERIGDAVVVIRDAAEQQLVDAVAAGDAASRLVYADWLEGRGDFGRAEFLRAQDRLIGLSPDDPQFEARSDRLREVAATTDLAWRSRVAHRTIEGCAQFDFACPKAWDALAPTTREGVRHCGSCQKTVHYCASIDEARAHAAAGRCVALDVTSPRLADDLAGPFGEYLCPSCKADCGPAEHCPRCGTAQRSMMRGMYLG